MQSIKKRNTYIDVLRGIAMLIVVLGHTMTGATNNSEKSFLFNIIWSLQMPLFILISGYVTRYSKRITSSFKLKSVLIKRTKAYLLPWFVWTIFVRGILINKEIPHLFHIFWNMDSSYWFLFTIWAINVVYCISEFFSLKVQKDYQTFKNTIMIWLMFVFGMIILLGIGIIFGLSFLGIKLTLYYMPFYFCGFLYGKYQDKIHMLKGSKKVIELVVAISAIVWMYSLIRINLYSFQDSGINIIIRAIVSMTGCITIFGLIRDCNIIKNTVGNFLEWCGKHSLEIYLTHVLVLNLVNSITKYNFNTLEGILIVFVNYVITLSMCLIIITMINRNNYLKKILFGK